MPKAVVPIEVKAVLPTTSGCAMFLGNEQKVFVIHIEQFIGNAISNAMRGVKNERPQTHDLIRHILTGTGATISRIVINDMNGGIFFARIILSMENELHSRKIIEIDARPSDSVALAVQTGAPIYASEKVWTGTEDVSEVLEKLEQGEDFPPGGGKDWNTEDDDDIPF
jgi:bifunctional DNase/RNase